MTVGSHEDRHERSAVASSPQHVAIVMDGNGRWAQERSLSRLAGHEAGARAAKAIIQHALTLPHLRCLSLFAFGQENWRRPAEEVNALMGLLSRVVDAEHAFFLEHQIQLRVIGDLSALPTSLQEKILRVQRTTRDFTGMVLVLALNYSGRWDITQAARSLARRVHEGVLPLEAINQACVQASLATGALPAPDLLIRTSGEQRLSNFMLWQMAYTELYFTQCAWPDFTPNDFDVALKAYAQRNRRFGDVSTVQAPESVVLQEEIC